MQTPTALEMKSSDDSHGDPYGGFGVEHFAHGQKLFRRESMAMGGENHQNNSLAVTSTMKDKEALDFEMEIEEKRQLKHQRSALFVLQKARDEYELADDDGETDNTFTRSELDLSLNFNGLNRSQVSPCIPHMTHLFIYRDRATVKAFKVSSNVMVFFSLELFLTFTFIVILFGSYHICYIHLITIQISYILASHNTVTQFE